MEIQRIRNLTTGIVHTSMVDIFEDIEYLVGTKGVIDSSLWATQRALEPFLRGRIADPRFWNDAADYEHLGELDLAPMNHEEKDAFWKRYGAYKDAEQRIASSERKKASF